MQRNDFFIQKRDISSLLQANCHIGRDAKDVILDGQIAQDADDPEIHTQDMACLLPGTGLKSLRGNIPAAFPCGNTARLSDQRPLASPHKPHGFHGVLFLFPPVSETSHGEGFCSLPVFLSV